MSMRLIEEMNRRLEGDDRREIAGLLDETADLAEAAARLGLKLNDVEREFLSGLPKELSSGLHASLRAALAAGRKVTVDWAPGFVPEVSVSVPRARRVDAVTILLRTPPPTAKGR